MPQAIRALERMGEQIGGVVGGGVGAAKDAARRAGYAAEDLLDTTARSIKRHPVRAVLASLTVAFAAGMLVGRVTRRP